MSDEAVARIMEAARTKVLLCPKRVAAAALKYGAALAEAAGYADERPLTLEEIAIAIADQYLEEVEDFNAQTGPGVTEEDREVAGFLHDMVMGSIWHSVPYPLAQRLAELLECEAMGLPNNTSS